MSATAKDPGLEPLRKALASKEPPRVVIAVGPDAWLRDAALRAVAEAVLGSAESPDLVTVRGDDAASAAPEEALGRFLDECTTGSLFGGAKVVALRGADPAIAADAAAFTAWLAKPSSAATAVVLAENLTEKVLSAAAKAFVVRCGGRGGAGEDPVAFAVRRAAGRGRRLGRDDAQLLVDCVGPDPGALDLAVDALDLLAEADGPITTNHVRALYDVGRDGNLYSFGDKLAAGDAAGAVLEAQRCFDEGIPDGKRVQRDEKTIAIRLVNAFTNSVARVRHVRSQLDRGVPKHAVDFGMPLPMEARTQAVRAATSRRREAIDALLLAAEDADRGIKSGGPQGRVAILRLAVRAGMVR